MQNVCFKRYSFSGGGPPLNIPPASAGAITATTVEAGSGGGLAGAYAASQLRKSPGSSGSGMARPVSGAFSLDIAKIEGQMDSKSGRSALMSRLVNHDNLDDILNGDPVVLPPTGKYTTQLQAKKNNP